jgi:CheY-like chemotaxis protein
MPGIVLVVEDERTIREGLQELLAADGYDVIAAAGGEEALELLRAGTRPDLVVMDLMMPEVSGADLLAAMRADPALAEIPVVIVSAVGGALKPVPGVVAIFPKPWNGPRLLETIRQHCG